MRNHVKIQAQCGDAYEFLMDVGLGNGELPDHVVMNFPLDAPRFLGALRWWPSTNKHGSGSPRVHVYTFARAEGDVTAEEAAVEAIASNLVVRTTETNPGAAKSRATELDEYGCQVQVHNVR